MWFSFFHPRALRRFFVVLFATCCCAVSANPRSLAADITILKASGALYYAQAVQGFKKSMPPDVHLTEYTLPESATDARELGQSIRADRPNLVLAVGLKAALIAKTEIPDVPIVFCLVLRPDLHGLPAPNMTGLSMQVSPKVQLEQIKRLTPRVRRIGVLHADKGEGSTLESAEHHAKALGLQLIALAVAEQEQVVDALHALLPQIDLLWLLPDRKIVTETLLPIILNSALDARIPIFGFSSTMVQRGALGALVVDPIEAGEQAGRIARALLHNPASRGNQIIQPAHPRLMLNLNTAAFLGLTPPPDVVHMASRIFGGPGAYASQGTPQGAIP